MITRSSTLADAAVVIDDRTIAWVGPAAALPAEYATATQVDYPGATILPGLIDAHVHLGFDGGPDPRHCWFMDAEADGEPDLRRLVRTHHKHGVDFIKVMATGGFMTTRSAPWYAQFTVDELAVIVEEAARFDTPVAAHVHGLHGMRRAVATGVSTLEHCSFVTETNERSFDAALAAEISDKGIVVSPTISVNAPHVSELTGVDVGEFARPMHDVGVRLIAGTDAGIDNTPHHQYAGGLQYLVSLGFTPEQVLAQATTDAADALGLGTITGRLEAGYDADLIVVDGNPCSDIAALNNLRRVIARGRDFVPDCGRFDVSAPGTPFADGTAEVDLRLLKAATERR